MESYIFKGHNKTLFFAFIMIFITYIFFALQIWGFISDVVNYITFISIFITILFELNIYKENSHKIDETKRNLSPKNDSIFTGLVDSKLVGEGNSSNLLQRQKHRKALKAMIKSKFTLNYEIKGIILTGESGAGKSILLKLLRDELKEDYNVILKQDGYNLIKNSPLKSSLKNIIIFDGFEKSLEGENIDVIRSWFSKYKTMLKKCVFIFSFPETYLTQVYNELNNISGNTHLKTYVLNLDQNDEKDYLKKISERFGVSEKKLKIYGRTSKRGRICLRPQIFLIILIYTVSVCFVQNC